MNICMAKHKTRYTHKAVVCVLLCHKTHKQSRVFYQTLTNTLYSMGAARILRTTTWIREARAHGRAKVEQCRSNCRDGGNAKDCREQS